MSKEQAPRGLSDPLPPGVVRAFAFQGSDGIVNTRTVTDTPQGAKVNAIVLGSGYSIIPRDDWTLEQINAAFTRVTVLSGGKIVMVEVRAVGDVIEPEVHYGTAH